MTTVGCYQCGQPVRIVDGPPYVGVCELCCTTTRNELMVAAEQSRPEGQRVGMSKTRS
jgi:hypothetical protein